jgi:hypothetical protein
MARWRRLPEDDIPPELVEFDPRDWQLGPPGMSRRQRWREAQFEYLRRHPDRTIGGLDVIDVIFVE